MKTVIVTGGCGFIGSHFVRLLTRRTKFRVVNLDKLTYAGDLSRLTDIKENARYRMVQGDIGDEALVDGIFREERPWGLVNFAAESHVDKSILDASPFLHTNILGVQKLLDASRRSGLKRFVQVSTDEVYGDASGRTVFREDSPLAPSSPYAASKAAADLLVMAYRRTYGIPALIVRTSNNYGPYQFPEKLIPLMISNALRAENLPVYGDGKQKRDWLYVGDNVEAILRVLKQGKVGSIYNVGTGKEKTTLEVVSDICRLLAEETGKKPQPFLKLVRLVTDRPGHDRRYAMNIEKARREIGWTPSTSFEEALKRTVSWYLKNQDWLKTIISGEYRIYYEAVYQRNWNNSIDDARRHHRRQRSARDRLG